MSNRYYDTAVFACDENHQMHPVVSEYFCNSGSGYYHHTISTNEKVYVIFESVYDECPTEVLGSYLPHTSIADLCSYFDVPTENMQTILHEATLDDLQIVNFVMVDVESVSAGAYQATCHHISREGIIADEYYLLEGDFGNETDEIIANLLSKY